MTLEADIEAVNESFRINARFRVDGLISVTGENGSGKTFLMKCLSGLAKTLRSNIMVDGREVSGYPPELRSIVYVSQNSFFPHMSAERHILYGLNGKEADSGTVSDVVDNLGIPIKMKVRLMSQGQRMRTAIATALISGRKVLLLDEVVSNISGGSEVLAYLKEFSRKMNRDIVVISHGYAVPDANSIIHMVNGTAYLEKNSTTT